LSDEHHDEKQLKIKAALYATRPGVVEHVRQTGRLPDSIPMGGAHIGARLLLQQRGWDIELREDEKLVYDALVRDLQQRPKELGSSSASPSGPQIVLIYGMHQGSLVFMERDKALENIAFFHAKTWGDLRANAPELYERGLEWRDCDTDEEPPDDQELDHQIAGEGNFLHFPEALMLEFIPVHLWEKFGRVDCTPYQDPTLELDPKGEKEIVEALQEEGYACYQDNTLLERIYTG
jgi:hypothetical protein